MRRLALARCISDSRAFTLISITWAASFWLRSSTWVSIKAVCWFSFSWPMALKSIAARSLFSNSMPGWWKSGNCMACSSFSPPNRLRMMPKRFLRLPCFRWSRHLFMAIRYTHVPMLAPPLNFSTERKTSTNTSCVISSASVVFCR